MGMELVNALEQVLALERARATGGEDDRDGLAVLVESLQLSERSLGRRPADDP